MAALAYPIYYIMYAECIISSFEIRANLKYIFDVESEDCRIDFFFIIRLLFQCRALRQFDEVPGENSLFEEDNHFVRKLLRKPICHP